MSSISSKSSNIDPYSQSEPKAGPTQRSQLYNYTLALTIAFGGFHLGYNVSIFNPFGKEFIDLAYNINSSGDVDNVLGNLNLFFCIGCMVGAFTGGYFAGWFGKVLSIIVMEFLSIGVQVMYFFSPDSLWLLYITRILCGFTVGNFNTLCPQANVDILPKAVLSFGGVMFYGAITTGILITSLFGSFVDHQMLAEHAKYF